ncbi:hypothetical protein SS1G_10479 [Sclerotinia sclerotiorum 1980 UF-70]|uniref:Uncharacterized protein n=1 Tax=Sclerotinia sclerotiorum (strain ATCC 18683 / 1980 / Ss-1) TaxID=665079 RepID=A7EYR3_SCLS1|nr:hypothetical protein SS1G_10479 [Sclerotinia sclerotiorum 1980 UF-70]EDN94605.1 hypothetical protein SS1G_10479 [Sclerotinia sclerotiorum 1980 UF-70]
MPVIVAAVIVAAVIVVAVIVVAVIVVAVIVVAVIVAAVIVIAVIIAAVTIAAVIIIASTVSIIIRSVEDYVDREMRIWGRVLSTTECENVRKAYLVHADSKTRCATTPATSSILRRVYVHELKEVYLSVYVHPG